MIRINIPGFFDSDKGGPRWGDCQMVNNDYGDFDVIDGYCGVGADRLIDRLKSLSVKNPYLHITHAHYDHYNGIERIIDDKWFSPKALYCYDPYTLRKDFSEECRQNIEALVRIINKAKKSGISVIYLQNGDRIVHHDIEIEVYRLQPQTAENTDSYINDGSLCYYFPKLRYLTSGDGPARIYDLCTQYNLRPVIFKIPHHGNCCPRSQANGMKALGALFCWDNDYNTSITDFLTTGRDRCIGAGIKYISCHGDINMIAYNGTFVIYKGSEHWSYKCGYKGKISLKSANLAIVKAVLKGDLGNGDARITALLDKGFKPASVQKEVNEMFKLVRG